jgi:predicted alpha/beta hydrolase
MTLLHKDYSVTEDECKCTCCGKTLFANTEAIVYHTYGHHKTNPPIVLGKCCAWAVVRSLALDINASGFDETWTKRGVTKGHAKGLAELANKANNWADIFGLN